jgi:hypothetical protein
LARTSARCTGCGVNRRSDAAQVHRVVPRGQHRAVHRPQYGRRHPAGGAQLGRVLQRHRQDVRSHSVPLPLFVSHAQTDTTPSCAGSTRGATSRTPSSSGGSATRSGATGRSASRARPRTRRRQSSGPRPSACSTPRSSSSRAASPAATRGTPPSSARSSTACSTRRACRAASPRACGADGGARLHLYSGFGARDRSQADKEFGRAVYGPDAADRAITICEALIEQAVRMRRVQNDPRG